MDSVSGVGVIDKAMVIVAALTRGPLDLADVQEATGLPRATAHRLVVALERHHLVRRDSVGRFCLGYELIALGRAASEQSGVGELALPILRSLRDDCGESVQLFVREDEGRRCVVSLQSPHALRWIVPEGSVLPLGAGSAGRVLSGGALADGGWVESVEEREPGVASVSAPVRGISGDILAAVSISGPVDRLTRSPGARLGSMVATAGSRIGEVLRVAQRS
ncbi:MAG: IclR family transcriptional regulator [Ilumatobacteraceae bacterium]